MLLFPHVGHLQVSITRPISYLYKSDSGIDKYEEEIVPDDESDRQENSNAEWLFGTSRWLMYVYGE